MLASPAKHRSPGSRLTPEPPPRKPQLEAELGYAETRLLLRNIEDSSFHDHAFAQECARGVFDAIAPLEAARAAAQLARPLIVRGYEALLWYEWLRASGALRIEPNKSFETKLKLKPGSFHNMYYVHKQISGDPPEPVTVIGFGNSTLPRNFVYEFEGDFYHARKLSEYQARYLFDTYVRDYFATEDNASLLPFERGWQYEPTRYREVVELAERRHDGVLDNTERERRLDEMRVMVVTFFEYFLHDRRNKVSHGAICDEVILLSDYLSTVPESEIDPPPSQPVESSPEDRTSAVNALMSETGFVENMQFSADLNGLQRAMTRLELNILTFELFHEQTSHEAADQVFGESPEDAERQIKDLQKEVADLYEALVQQIRDFAPEQPDQIRTFEAMYQERKNQLTAWKKNEKLDLTWRWYGTAPESP